jgi:hypothetical protein
LLGICALGFLTVADDLRHIGELIGVASIGVVGLAATAISHIVIQRRRAQDG